MPVDEMNPLILAVDTTHEFGSLALARGTDLLEETLLHSPAGFGHILFQQIGGLLERHGVGVADIGLFAAASGPGSFTGVRVGLACIKGLAEANGKPAAAVSNLRAAASYGTANLRAAVFDARRGEVYGAVYGAEGQVVCPEVVQRFGDWLASLPVGELEFVSSDFSLFRQAVEGTRFAVVPVMDVPRALAGAIARIALADLRQGRAGEPAALDANYVRRSDAELFWKE